jgi:hypothetical protein
VIDRALLAAYRRQQELAWIEQLVEEIEAALEEIGVLGRPRRVPAMCFLDLVGSTRLTEEHGDQAAAELAATLSMLVDRSSREHGGVPVKWLGDRGRGRAGGGPGRRLLRPNRQPGRPDRRLAPNRGAADGDPARDHVLVLQVGAAEVAAQRWFPEWRYAHHPSGSTREPRLPPVPAPRW